VTTPLSPAHRSWRAKVFVSTWLAYVGYYFCRRPFEAAKAAIGTETGWSATQLGNIWVSYLIAYAIGQFIASGMGTKLGPRRNVLLGMALSIAVTVAMGVTLSMPVMMGLMFVNGLSQATGWSGNVGTMAGWFHRHERGRVMGIWSTNFVTGSLASRFAMGWVLSMHAKGEAEPWRWCFYGGAIVLGVVWMQFYFLQRNRPEDVGLTPIDDPKTEVDEAEVAEPAPEGFFGLSRTAWINLLLVGGFYFFIKFIRYGVWSWSAYFMAKNFGLTGARANVYSTVFDVMGALGVVTTGWMSDRFFGSRRSGVALLMLLAMTGVTGLLMAFGGASVGMFAVLLGLVGFTLFGPDSLLTGAGAIDIGGRQRATFTVAIISGFGGLGAVVQELVIGRLYDAKGGDLAPIFASLFGSAALATLFCAALVWRNQRGGRGV